MKKKITEIEALDILDITNFNHITKDKVMKFAAMAKNMDLEIVEKAIEQFPDFAKLTFESLKDYTNVMKKIIDANLEGSKQCNEIYNDILNELKKCLDKEDLAFEEKKYYFDKMIEIAKMAEIKDTENKKFYDVVSKTTTQVLGLAFIAIITIGGSIIKEKIDKN